MHSPQNQMTRKPTLVAGTHIASIKHQHTSSVGPPQSSAGNGSLSNKRHNKKNSLNELYNIYMAPPNSFTKPFQTHQSEMAASMQSNPYSTMKS
jgi:hypothetical protein